MDWSAVGNAALLVAMVAFIWLLVEVFGEGE